jgi:Ras family protein T1|tara:strand:+ start:19 stop:1584 length:1566 start_codon:yes stop_codon:yes gene_type:complete
MASAHPPVRIVVLGDKGVGKTSLIATLVSEHFSAKPRDQPLPEVSIAGDLTNDNVGMTIVDTPSNPAHGTGLTEQAIADMRRADVAVLLYDTSDATTWQNINHHLDAIQSHMIKGPASSSVDNGAATGDEAVASSPRRRFPVVLVGNKIDLRDKDLEGNSEAQLQSRVASILRKYDFVEACLECSCKSLLNIETVFYFAQKAVVYPVPPLLQISDKCDGGHVLTTDFRVALNRVFRIFDVDGDGVLRDDELNAFQETCFGAKLQRSDVQNVKAVLSKASTPSMPFIVSDRNGVAGISRAGFMHLNQMFIERNRPETSWQVLRKFDYNDDVALDFTASQRLTLGAATSTAYANGGIVNPTLHPDQTVELSSFAFAFLERIFHRFASPHAAHVVAAERGLVPDTWRGLEAEDEEDESFDESFDGEPAWQLKVLRMQDLEAIFAIAGPNTLEQWWTGSGAGRASRTRENVICDPHLLPSAVCDWHFNTREPEKSGMKLAGWLAMWAAATMEDHMHVWYNLLCLG